MRESLASVLAQEGPSFEVIAVDDGSTDGTAAAIESLKDPRLRLLRQEKRGFTAAINVAVRASRGKYVAIHGAGDISLPGRLARQAAVLDAQDDVGVVGCWVDNEDLIADTVVTVRRPKIAQLRRTAIAHNPFTHGEVMYRRALYDRVGGYRETFVYAQDHDLWIRMGAHCDYAVVPELLYRRKRIPSGVSTSAESLILQGMLSEFAVECGCAVDRGEADPVDRLGPMAPLLRRRSARLAARLGRIGARFLATGRLEPGRRLVAAAAAERLTPTVLATIVLSAISHSPAVWRLLGAPIVFAAIRFRRQTPAALAATAPDPVRE